MITSENYFERIKKVDVSQFPEGLRKAHDLIVDATDKGKNWNRIYNSPDLNDLVTKYFKKLEIFLKEDGKKITAEKPVKETPHKEKITDENSQRKAGKERTSSTGKMVDHFPEEYRFIRRFINLNGKSKEKPKVLNFINALKRSIVERRMTKDSPYKKEINNIQLYLIRKYNEGKARIRFVIDDKIINQLKESLGEEIVYPSISFLKRFINLHGKPNIRNKAQQLFDGIKRAMNKGVFLSTDKHVKKVKEVYHALEVFLKAKKAKTLTIQSDELSGILGACGCEKPKRERELAGVDYGGRKPTLMNSMDFANLNFQRIGFKGKWKEFFGDPSPGFTVMVSSLPKYGKSTMCLDFAAYLARNHGKVLYVAREEGLDRTLQDKVNDPDIKHPNLTVSSYIPTALGEYDYVFLDSVNKLQLQPRDLELLKRNNPGKSFIYVFQTTKQGRFRGNNEFQHDVDIVVDMPEIGKAVQYGRYNAMSEMDVFS